MKRILITGITGYIGSNLARALSLKYKVYGMVRYPLHTEYISDFQDRISLFPYDGTYESVLRAIRKSKPDLVYHLASLYIGNHRADQIAAMQASNLLFGNYVLEAMTDCGIRDFVNTTSVMCNYRNEVYNPLNLYAATKQAFSDILKYYTEVRNLRSLTLVLSDSYGPNDHRGKILNLLKDAARNGTKVEMSAGTQIYDVLYINDIVNAFEMCFPLLKNQTFSSSIYQLYNANQRTLKEVVEILQKVTGASIQIEWGKRPQPAREIKDGVHVYAPLPGWHQKVSLQEGLRCFWFDHSNLEIK